MSVDPLNLLEPAATRVRDPVSDRSVWLAGLVRAPKVEGNVFKFDLVFSPDHTRDDRRAIEEALVANLRGLGYTGEIVPVQKLEMTGPKPAPKKDAVPGMSGPGVMPHGGPIQKKKVEGVKHIVVVASGKGGVGKSTVSANLAVALQRLGHATGLLDADVYGPSVPTMMNVSQQPMVGENKKIIPTTSYGVRCLSTGMLVPAEEAMIWRGPMVMGIIRQLLQDAVWGELDYLIVDLPPGTGDAQLTLIQGAQLSGAVVVTTPQQVALADAIRGITMFQKLEVPILGVVENMSWYELPDGTRDPVFGEGGGRRVAEKYSVDLLAQIPLRTALRVSGDQGLPAALGADATATAFADLARKIVAKLPVK